MEYPMMGEKTKAFIEEHGFLPSMKHNDDDPEGYLGWERWMLASVTDESKKQRAYNSRDKKRIWSVMAEEGGDCNCLVIEAGEQYGDVLFFMVSTKRWEDEKFSFIDYHCEECLHEWQMLENNEPSETYKSASRGK
jgi:hypothetical protein